jgi:GT2 family glycosyltransferase
VPQPLLSIVTPSLNQGRYIAQCLESVAREMATPFAQQQGVEHIVMDGGSIDETVGLLERATHLAHWQSAPDAGQSDAINQGLLQHATGRYATWLNADDWFEDGALEPMLARLTQHDAPDVLVGRCRFVQDGATIFSPSPPGPIDLASLLSLRSKWFAGQLIVQPEAFFSRSLFERLGGLNEANHYTMDHELWLRLLEAGARFETIDHPVACMRVHDAQKTADNARIVRSLIDFGRPFLERHQDAIGSEPAREFAALEHKLSLSQPMLRRLKAPWTALAAESSTHAAPAAGPASFHLAPLRAALARVPARPGPLRAYRTRTIGQPPADLPIKTRPAANQPAEAIVLWHALSTAADPRALLADAVDDLRPGGLLIAGAELNACEAALLEYTQAMARLVDQQISQDHDWLVDPAAMRWVRSLADATPEDDARFMATQPHATGLDVEALMQEAGLERRDSIAYGGLSWHPLTPFPAVEGLPGRDANAWVCGVWAKT